MATYWENSCSFGLRYVSWYKYLIVSLVFSHLGFWSGNLFLIAPFPDFCLLVPLHISGRFFRYTAHFIKLQVDQYCEYNSCQTGVFSFSQNFKAILLKSRAQCYGYIDKENGFIDVN